MLDAFLDAPLPALKSLATALRSGRVTAEDVSISLSRILGRSGQPLASGVQALFAAGMSAEQAAIVIDGILAARTRSGNAGEGVELVLSGPDVVGIPTGDTAATMRRLIADAQREVILVGYAVHRVRDLFEPLADRLANDSAFSVVLYLDIARPQRDTSLTSEIVRRFAGEFRRRHWPWAALPKLFYDPRALSTAPQERASLHAKCLITDRSRALITSANLTEAAQHRNIEAGVLLHRPAVAAQLADYFDGLRNSGQLARCNLE
jgi:phosphatidylserine/phosphatidylglycerophosphate/cardiolipin synthase-like enzyme